jgi:hypothetical protein
VPLLSGANAIGLRAVNPQGLQVGSDSITITNTGTVEPASAANLVVSELMYHPSALTDPEKNAGYTSEEEFEYVELQNVGAKTVDLTGAQFTVGITFGFTGSAVTSLSPGARVLVVRNTAAFAFRHGAGLPVAGTFSGGLDNGGERLLLVDRGGLPIVDFSYDDEDEWPLEADGGGYSLTLIRPESRPDPDAFGSWRPSVNRGGSPNGSDALAASAFGDLLAYALVDRPAVTIEDGVIYLSWRERVGADEARVIPQVAQDLVSWETDPGDASLLEFVDATSAGDGSRAVRYRSTGAPGAHTDRYFRLLIQGGL